MSLKRWYWLILWLPFVFPLCLALFTLALTGDIHGVERPPVPQMDVSPSALPLILLTDINLTFVGAALRSAIAYVLFVVCLSLRYRHQDMVFWGKLTWRLPLMFIPLCGVGLMLQDWRVGAFWGALYCLPLGYFYVFLGHIITRIALRRGWVFDS